MLPGLNLWLVLMKSAAAGWTAAPHAAGADRQQEQSLKQHRAALRRLGEKLQRLGPGSRLAPKASFACRWGAASRLWLAA